MRKLLAAIFFALTFCAAVPAFAEGAPPQPPPGFEPITGKEAKAEAVHAPTLVVVAYGTVFVLIFGYMIHMVRSQTAISREMRELAEKVAKADTQ